MSDYNYLNARLRSLSKDLFAKEQYQDLLARPNAAEMRQFFLATPYRTEVSEFPGEELERAVSRNLHRQFRTLRRWAGIGALPGAGLEGGEPRGLIDLLFLRWDLHNIKTLLRAKRAGSGEQALRDALISAGEHSPVELEELAKTRTLREAVNLLLTWRAPFRSGVAQYEKTLAGEGPLAADFLLDSAYGRTVEASLPGGADENTERVRHMLAIEIDQKNVRTVFKLAETQEADRARAYFLQGGRLGAERLRDLVTSRTQEERVEKLRSTYLAPAVRSLGNTAPTAAQIEAAVERLFELEGVRSARENPLSIGVAIAYIARKVREAINLRIILKGKRFGFKREELEQELAYV